MNLIAKTVNCMLLTGMLVVFAGCPQDPIVPPTPRVDSGGIVDACINACHKLKELGCVEGNPIDMNTPCKTNANCGEKQYCSLLGTCVVTCAQFCVDTYNSGIYLDPDCVAKISECSQVNKCTAIAQSTCDSGSCQLQNDIMK